MRVFNYISIGKHCGAYGGCGITIKDIAKTIESSINVPSLSSASAEQMQQFLNSTKRDDNRLIVLPKTNKDFFFLLDGTMFLTYGAAESFSLSSPYTSTEFVDYIDRWNYDENFNAKSTKSTVFLQLHVAEVETVTVKVAVLEPGSTVKHINSNSKLILVKNENATCEIDGIQHTDPRTFLQFDNLIEKDVNITVSEKSHLIYLQS
jgi:hypothetical protein